MPIKRPASLENLEVWNDIFSPSLRFGVVTGLTGTAASGIWAVYRSRFPRLVTTLYTLQSFAIGTTFYALRATLLHVRPFSFSPQPLTDSSSPANPLTEPPTASERLTASTLSGGVAGGSILALTSGGRAIIPGTLLYGLLGFVGQKAYTWADERHTQQSVRVEEEQRGLTERRDVKEGWIDKVASMKWTGLTKLSDEEYAGILGEKVLKIEAEVAIIEEEIEKLRRKEREKQKGEANQSKPTMEARKK